mgnify:CR=1 FL=1
MANKLINESSPYLLQHAHNPVEWHPWGEEALEKAKKENKPLIISVGYSACHWCHVMEKESFEDETVAAIMNKHFVCIKVDREERPDIDQIYMEAAQLITGGGGWPLNAFALPEGNPFYAGTYFRKQLWIDLLQQIAGIWKENPGKLLEQAESVTEGIDQSTYIQLKREKAQFEKETADKAWENWKDDIDPDHGGMDGAPKFPMPVDWEYLLAYHHHTDNSDALLAVKNTLDNIAKGGIYDHVGGGFARYSVDREWHVPHFEKMLYDNAQLVSLYCNAWKVIEEDRWEQLVHNTLEFIGREMTSPEGGFYSSLDADSEGVEGKYYVWDIEEFEELFGEDAPLLEEYFDVSEEGNWEGTNVLRINHDNSYFLDKYELNIKEFSQKVGEARQKLITERNKRERPGLDDKILTAWNAMMLKAYADAYRTFGRKEYLQTALRNADFIRDVMMQEDGRLNRIYKDGKSSINAFLDDYALSIQAFISLYQATFDEQWLETASKLNDYVFEHFHHKKKGMFYYSSDIDPALISRKMELADNVIPASNSVMAHNLYDLGKYYDKEEYVKQAGQMLAHFTEDFKKHPPYYANWGRLLLKLVYPYHEVAITGNESLKKRIELDAHFLPDVLLMGAEKESKLPLLQNKFRDGKTTIYVCAGKVCKHPVENVDEALEQV